MCRALILIGLLFAGLVWAADKPAELRLRDMEGKKVRLSDYRGKVVVLNCWATWCGPCREEMPMLVEAEKTWAARGVVFIAVSLDDEKTRKNIPDFVGQYGVRFPLWVGASADELDLLLSLFFIFKNRLSNLYVLWDTIQLLYVILYLDIQYPPNLN